MLRSCFSTYHSISPRVHIRTLVSPLRSLSTKVSLSARVLQKIGEDSKLTPVEKGYHYLAENCNARWCFQPLVSANPQFNPAVRSPFPEIFDTTLILDLIGETPFCPVTVRTCLRYISDHQGDDLLFRYFEDPSLLPPDVDDTALAMLVLLKHKKRSTKEGDLVADKIVRNFDKEGRIQTYFPPREGREERVDASVCANALRLLHFLGRGYQARATEDYLYQYLVKRTHLSNGGNLYYGNQTFFYFMGEAIKYSSSLKERFAPLFVDRVRSCIGSTTSPIDLATRVIVSNDFGIPNEMESTRLANLQNPDGSWPIDVAYTGSRKNLYWGSPMISTAFALRALDHPNVAANQKRTSSLTVLNNGFELRNEILHYSKSYEPFDFAHTVLAATHTQTGAALLSKFYDKNPKSSSNNLTYRGKAEANALGDKLRKEIGIDRVMVFHGNNTRTLQTAVAICEKQYRPSRTSVPWLSDFRCDYWSGLDHSHVLSSDFTAAAMFNHSNCLAHPPGGDNFLHFLNTIYLGLQELKKMPIPKQTVILLCTSRLNLVALQILLRRDIIYDADSGIDWAQMAKKTKSGTLLKLK